MKNNVSRQRLWQIKKQSEGKCEKCGKNRDSSSNSRYCLRCHNALKIRQNKKKREAKKMIKNKIYTKKDIEETVKVGANLQGGLKK